MKDWIKRRLYFLGAIFFFSFAVFCWRYAVSFHGQMQVQEDYATLSGGLALDGQGYREMTETEQRAVDPIEFAAWTQLDRQQLEQPDTRRNETVSVLLVRGDSRLVLPVSASLSPDDVEGCLLDRQTATALFGVGIGIGGVIRYEDRDYTVRGLFSSPAPTILLHAQVAPEEPLTNISLIQGDRAEEFQLRHGLSGGLVVSGLAYIRPGWILSRLPVAVAIILVMGILYAQRRSQRDYPVRRALLTVILLGVGTFSLLAVLTCLPGDWIPSRWSDFSFWSKAFGDWKQRSLELLAAPKYRPDLLMLGMMARTAMGIPGSLSLIWSVGCLRGWLRSMSLPETKAEMRERGKEYAASVE